MLDLYSYGGGFAIAAARAPGRAEVTAVDSSAPALEMPAASARRNGVDGTVCRFLAR